MSFDDLPELVERFPEAVEGNFGTFKRDAIVMLKRDPEYSGDLSEDSSIENVLRVLQERTEDNMKESKRRIISVINKNPELNAKYGENMKGVSDKFLDGFSIEDIERFLDEDPGLCEALRRAW
jgi:hypothetical protein